MKKYEELKKLLVVVDMINGFVKEGNMADPYIEHIIPNQLEIINEIIKEEEGLAFIRDTHDLDCIEFKRYPIHCVKGTSESEVVDELKPFEKKGITYLKNSTSTIYAPNFLNDIDKMKKLKEVIITGCCTDICVMNLAIPLKNYFDQMNRDIEITVPEDAIETYNSDIHNRDDYNKMAKVLMKQSGINIVNTYGGNRNGK